MEEVGGSNPSGSTMKCDRCAVINKERRRLGYAVISADDAIITLRGQNLCSFHAYWLKILLARMVKNQV